MGNRGLLFVWKGDELGKQRNCGSNKKKSIRSLVAHILILIPRVSSETETGGHLFGQSGARSSWTNFIASLPPPSFEFRVLVAYLTIS